MMLLKTVCVCERMEGRGEGAGHGVNKAKCM